MTRKQETQIIKDIIVFANKYLRSIIYRRLNLDIYKVKAKNILSRISIYVENKMSLADNMKELNRLLSGLKGIVSPTEAEHFDVQEVSTLACYLYTRYLH